MQETDKIKVAIVGADREGLEILGILRKEKSLSVSMLLDPDKGALGFRLEEYGYAYSDDLHLRLSHRMRDIATFQDLGMVIDASPDRYHKDLYDLDIYPAEVINGSAARLIWELKSIEDPEDRRPVIDGRIKSVIEAVSHGLQSVPQAPAIDEHCALLLRTSFLGTHATAAQLTILEKGDPYKIIKDINAGTDLLIKRVCNRPYIREWEEADKIIRYVVENRRPWEGGMGTVKGWGGLGAVPVIEESDLLGILWLFYPSPALDRVRDDTAFVSSLLPFFGKALKGAMDSEGLRLASVADALSDEPLSIIGSDKPIGSKLKEINHTLYKLLKARDSHIYIKDPATGDLVLQATTYKYHFLLGKVRIKKGQGVLGEVVERGTPLALMEAAIGDSRFEKRFARSEDTIALLYLPLIVKDKGVGIIAMEFTNVHHITPDIYQSLQNVGSHLANAIGSDVERYRMSQKIIKLSTVNEEGIELLSTADLQKVFALATASSAMLLDSEVSILRLTENAGLPIKSTYGIHEGKVDQTLLELDQGIAATVAQTRVPVLIHDLPEYTELAPSQDFPYKTAIVLPLLFNKELFGTLSLYNKMASEAFSSIFFTEDDREIIEHFIQYVARGIVNAKRYSERQSLITIDEVTGLRNERYLQMRFPEEINRAKRFNRCVSLIFFEAKPFDDAVIKDVARLTKETFRYIDVLVRLKDAKFAALLPDTGEGVKDAARRLAAGFSRLKGKRPDLALYAGYSTYPDDSDDIHDLIKKASKLRQY